MKFNLLFGTLVPVVFALSACKQEGTITVFSPLAISPTTTVQPGKYLAQLDVLGDKKFNLFIDSGSNEYKLSFWLPPGTSFPEGNGVLKLSPSQTHQNYGVEAVASTHVSKSDSMTDVESCVYYVSEYKCRQVFEYDYNDGRHDNHGHTNDDIEPRAGHWKTECGRIAVQGYQQVTFHFVATDSGQQVQVLNAKTAEVLASFYTNSTATQKIVDYASYCH